MALRWDFNTDKIGEMEFKHYGRNIKLNLYSGNALMIGCHEYEEEGRELYEVITFWADKEHLKNMLGLSKGYEKENYLDTGYDNLKITLHRDYRGTKDIVNAFIKAKFKNKIEIKIIDKE